jgi:hypothetical protein
VVVLAAIAGCAGEKAPAASRAPDSMEVAPARDSAKAPGATGLPADSVMARDTARQM